MKYIVKTVIIVILFFLIFLRVKYDNSTALVIIQYAGLGVALGDLFVKLLKVNHSAITIIIVLLLLVAFGIVTSLGISQMVPWLYDAKAMDVISLLTLVISLPSDLYINLCKKERTYV